MKKYKHGLFIGRFQPFHNGHAEVIRQMHEECVQITIIVGSAFSRPNVHRNPFLHTHRVSWIQYFCSQVIQRRGIGSTRVFSVEDHPYDDQKWAASIEQYIGYDTVMYCHEKEDTTYFKWFPDTEKTFVKTAAGGVSATDIRNIYFGQDDFDESIMVPWESLVPEFMVQPLRSMMTTPWYDEMVREKRMIEDYKAQFASLPYPPSFNTGDALVTCKGRVLMIKRGQFPAKGSLALPGGFLNVNTDASLVDCALRELKEETAIKVPPAVLRGSIKQVRTFDHMHRDPRGRIITTAVHLDVSNEIGFPKVRAEDDAAEALWVPRHEIRRENCFGDHYDIIDTMIGL